ncbi:MAG: Ppx/GppA phosphatase family protein [Spirochaetia bacterium]|jgi:exopolyphosphatase/guanosine-5'-triphosphate,3'-diphosphate pyrophosphatase
MPERVAAIDVGTNAIRFFAAESDERGGFHVVGETRTAVRLGHGVFSSGQIDAGAAAEAAAGLAQAARQMSELSIERYRAVATSAVRESQNRRAFVRQVREVSGLRLEVISGSEEIRLVHAAVKRRMPLGRDTWVLVELGGGSVEIALVDDLRVSWSETHAMGAVRLMEMFVRGSSEPKEFSRLVQEYAATIRLPARIADRGVKGFLATGGNIESIARICQGSRIPTGGPLSIPVGEVRELIGKLSQMSVSDRQKEYDLRADRADVIVPAAIVYAHLAERFNAPEIVIPGGGVREGIVFDLMQRRAARREADASVIDDALLLGRKFLFDEKHALHVARLAGSLYDQLGHVHGMGDRDRRLLVAAALLHDVGSVVSLKSHHKHALYLIARSDLPGFSAREMLIIGTIARYHRKAPPSALHHEFTQLSLADRQRVRLLAGLLRIADALDKEHRQKIQGIVVVRKGTEVRIQASGADDVLLEQWALRKKDDLFREVFSLEVTLSRDGAGTDG